MVRQADDLMAGAPDRSGRFSTVGFWSIASVHQRQLSAAAEIPSRENKSVPILQRRADATGAVALGQPGGGDDVHWFWCGDSDDATPGELNEGEASSMTPTKLSQNLYLAVSM